MGTIHIYGSTSGSSGPIFSFVDDTDPPIVLNQDPAPNEKFVPITHNLISFDVVDAYSGVVLNTLDAYIDGYWAFKNGSFQSPFDGSDAYLGTVAFDGYEGYAFIFDYAYLWEADKQIDLRVLASDALGNNADVTWWFRTPENVPPIVINQDPAPNETKVSVLKELLEFDVVSTRTKIYSNLIDAYVDGVLAFYNETFFSPFDGLDAYFGHIITVDGYDGYKVKLDYTDIPWDSYQTVLMEVIAEDTYGFIGSDSWSFRTEDLYPPTYKLVSVFPPPASAWRSKNTLVKIDIYDTESGVDPSSVNVYVNSVHVYNGTTKTFISDFDGPQSSVTPALIDGYHGFKIVVDKKTPYRSGDVITAQIYAKDYEGN